MKQIDRAINKSTAIDIGGSMRGKFNRLFGDSVRRLGFRDPKKIRQLVLPFLILEYSGRNRNNAQYAQDLYHTFMRCFAGASEEYYWVNKLNHGIKTQEHLHQFYIQSPEYQRSGQPMINEGCYA
jgi:hypothetical protein